MIKIRGLTKSYGTITAIKDLNFSVQKGEVVGFLGPNGAGKSTTMKIITGYMAPTTGSVEVAGYDVFENPIEVKKRIGYLPETPPLYTDMFVAEYLEYVARLKGVESNKVKSQVQYALEKTNIQDVSKRLIQNLSKGYKQRVGLAQALVSDPDILILDEPTVGLDPKQVLEVRDLIKSLRGKHTIVLSTHILSEVQATCERIIIINRGTIVAEDTLKGLDQKMEKGRRIILRVKTVSDQLTKDLKGVPGVLTVESGQEAGTLVVQTENDEAIQEKVASKVAMSGAGLMEIRSQSYSLEDIFIKVTSEGAVQ